MRFINNLKFGFSLLKAKLNAKKVPFLVQFTLTNRCNSFCSYCYARYYDRYQEDLSDEQVFKIIDQLAIAGTWRVNLVGGEPLLRENIGGIINYVKKRGMECAMTTNGHLVPQKIDELKNLDILCLSLDGEQKAHDVNRGEGSFAKVTEALEVASSHRIPLQIATVLTKENLNSLDFIFAIAYKYSIPIGFTTLITQSSPEGKVTPSGIPSDEEYRKALRKIIEAKKKRIPILFSVKSLEYSLRWPLSYKQDKIIGKRPDFEYIPCLAGRFYGIIDANGDIYPCPALVGEVSALNCLEVGLKKAWEEAGKHKCQTCHFPCNNDFNLLFALNPTVIDNILKTYKSPLFKQERTKNV